MQNEWYLRIDVVVLDPVIEELLRLLVDTVIEAVVTGTECFFGDEKELVFELYVTDENE